MDELRALGYRDRQSELIFAPVWPVKTMDGVIHFCTHYHVETSIQFHHRCLQAISSMQLNLFIKTKFLCLPQLTHEHILLDVES